MKITTSITSWGFCSACGTQPHFYEHWELILTTPVCTKEQSVEVNEDDMQFNVRQIVLHSVSHYPSQPQSMTNWIPIQYTRRETYRRLRISETHVARSLSESRHTDTHRHTLSTTVWLEDEVGGITVLTCDDKHRKTNTCHTYESIYLRTVCATVRREILTVQSQGHREKWSRRWRGVNMKKWLDAIKKR